MRRRLLLVAAALLVAACTGARIRAPESGPEDRDRLAGVLSNFDHDMHSELFAQAGWSCTDCHPIGAWPEGEALELGQQREPAVEADLLYPPHRVCHTCHRPEVSTDAPGECTTCHTDDSLPVPTDHTVRWNEEHPREAMARPATCYECHESYMCVSCHVRRDQAQNRVHSLNWLSLHGMAARSEAVTCEQCHEGETCTQCHLDPAGRKGW